MLKVSDTQLNFDTHFETDKIHKKIIIVLLLRKYFDTAENL